MTTSKINSISMKLLDSMKVENQDTTQISFARYEGF